MLDAPVKMGWVGVFITAPLIALALGDQAFEKLIFCTLALIWSWMTLLPRETPTMRWMPVFALVVAMGCGATVTYFKAPWLSGSLCLLAVFAALAAAKMEQAARWLIVTSALAAALVRASGGDFGPNPFSEWLASIGLSPDMAWNVTVFLRKTVHFTYFGLIGWTAYRGIRELEPRMIMWWPMGWAFLNATLDETRQHFVPDRTGSIWDVALDMAGAAVFIALAHRKWSQAPKDLAPESGAPA